MEALSATSAIVGLAVPVFQCAKALRDRIKLVASEKAELLAALTEYEKDINLLESLYNNNKELLDQQCLDTDLKKLAEIIRDLDDWLNSINPNLGKKKLPSLKELWKSGDLREKLVGSNAKIGSVRTRWQMRLQICTLVSTNVILGRMDSAQTETTALLQQVLTMLQQGPVRERSRTLSMHSQVEPVGFNSETTKVVANTTTSVVTFSILSLDASLSYDRINLRPEEYRTLLASDSNTIELSTENGKTVICRKQANEMGQYLDQAEILLQDVVQSRDISTIVVLHHLRDLAEILDNLNLYDECHLTGNCALDFAEALGRRSLEFRHEQALTLALIAGLSVFQPRARTLFIQAVSICEEVVANHASHSNKITLFNVLGTAGFCAEDSLATQWLERAVQLMTKELPPTMVHHESRGIIYNNYGTRLLRLQQCANATEAYHESISIRRIFVDNPAGHNFHLAGTLVKMGITLDDLGRYDDAIAVYEEALDICTGISTQDTLQYNELMANALHNYGNALWCLNQFSEAAAVQKQAVSFLRNLAQTGNEWTEPLCQALHQYGNSRYSLGKHAKAVLAYQEYILLLRVLAATDPLEEKYLREVLHNVANSFNALGRFDEANTAAIEALERNHGRAYKWCDNAPDFEACFVCQRAVIPDSLSNTSVYRMGQKVLGFLGWN